ncbi:MAG: methyl-accepting chemotaxis protein [Candidatus Omnitrophica bacterium]|nr:methyl-accepting chemotaxis protein [Candidatus Omnitrophota bacterium]
MIGALLFYVSRGTITTAYLAEGIKVQSTFSFFFVNFLLISLIVLVTIGLSAFAVFIYLSHRMAGPLYRFEKSLYDIIADGDLRYRIQLRSSDQFEEMQQALNGFFECMEDRIKEIKYDVSDISSMLRDEAIDRIRLKESVDRLADKLEFFKTST